MSEIAILTVGHSTHPIERFLELLTGARVEVIADVRRYPGSRRNPQFGAAALVASLAEAGIGYEPFGEGLGGRRARAGISDPRAPDNSGWRNASFRAYADHMSDPAFAAGLARLESLASERTTAVMCAESHPSRCHRQLIADALVARGRKVSHILPDGTLADHSLSPHAQLREGVLSYPGEPRLEL